MNITEILTSENRKYLAFQENDAFSKQTLYVKILTGGRSVKLLLRSFNKNE